MERLGDLIKKNLSDVPKSKIFVYFTKITAASWSINKIIPASISLVRMGQFLDLTYDLVLVK